MEGYIVKSGSEYLTKALFWFAHSSIELAYVFNSHEAGDIRRSCADWDEKPESLIPATYQDDVVTVAGPPQAF